jgi:hypothetical protein
MIIDEVFTCQQSRSSHIFQYFSISNKSTSTTLKFIGVDTAGNVEQVQTQTYTISTSNTGPAAPTVDDPTSGTGYTNAANPITISGTTQTGVTSVTIYDSETQLPGTATISRNSFTYSATLAEGQHSITAKATDADGTTGPSSTAVAFTVDRTAPAAPSISPPDGTIFPAPPPAGTANFIVTGNTEAYATVNIYRNSILIETVTADNAGVWGTTPQILPPGSYTYKVTATDAANNTSPPSSVTITVRGFP